MKEWVKMKEKMRNQFLPFNYTQDLYKNLHNLRQHGTVDEYTEKFYQLVARVDINETKEQMVARYLSGLKLPIQESLSLHSIWTVSEAYNRALMVEKQFSRRSFAQSQPFGETKPNGTNFGGKFSRPTTHPFQQDKASNAISTPVNIVKQPLKQPPIFSFKCYKCGEAGHKATDCKKSGPIMTNKGKALMLEELEMQEVTNYPLYDEDNAEIIGRDSKEGVGLELVMKRTLLAPKKDNNEEWLRSNIFHSTCNIGGRVCYLVIDGGSYENVVSQEVVDKLGLQTELHPQPYKLT